MRCSAVNFIQYIEGSASEEMKKHIAECPSCQEDLKKYSRFMKKILPVYRAGKRQERELDRKLEAMDLDAMQPLPSAIAARVKALRERSLVGRLKKIIGDKQDSARELIDAILNPQMAALPASPKDIAKTKKDKRKTKKVQVPKK